MPKSEEMRVSWNIRKLVETLIERNISANNMFIPLKEQYHYFYWIIEYIFIYVRLSR